MAYITLHVYTPDPGDSEEDIANNWMDRLNELQETYHLRYVGPVPRTWWGLFEEQLPEAFDNLLKEPSNARV